VSFFDEDDEPRSRPPRPRRAGGDVSADTQTIRMRQAAAAIGIVVVLLLLVFVVRSCQSTAKENALKDYNREVSTIGSDSSKQIGAEFFSLLGEGGSDSPADLQSAISSFKVQADQQLSQAEGLDVPDEMRSAHESLLIALDLEGIAVSTGSACSSGTLEPSHVLKAMGFPAHRTQNSLRFSLGAANTDADIDRAIAVLPAVVQKLRSLTRAPVRA